MSFENNEQPQQDFEHQVSGLKIELQIKDEKVKELEKDRNLLESIISNSKEEIKALKADVYRMRKYESQLEKQHDLIKALMDYIANGMDV